jgi:hypothetical protein
MAKLYHLLRHTYLLERHDNETEHTLAIRFLKRALALPPPNPFPQSTDYLSQSQYPV